MGGVREYRLKGAERPQLRGRHWHTLMQIIGLIGGVASGKSAVGAALERRGAVVFNADEFGHAVLKEPEVRGELVARWGPGVLGEDGEISRPAVAKIVFARTPEGEQ